MTTQLADTIAYQRSLGEAFDDDLWFAYAVEFGDDFGTAALASCMVDTLREEGALHLCDEAWLSIENALYRAIDGWQPSYVAIARERNEPGIPYYLDWIKEQVAQ